MFQTDKKSNENLASYGCIYACRPKINTLYKCNGCLFFLYFSAGVIAGIVIGVLVVVGLIVGLIIWLVCRKKKRKSHIYIVVQVSILKNLAIFSHFLLKILDSMDVFSTKC